MERRRRDTINEKIYELSTLLPSETGDLSVKLNKGTVLSRAVDYIRHVQYHSLDQMTKIQIMESIFLRLINEKGITESDLGLPSGFLNSLHSSFDPATHLPPNLSHSSDLGGGGLDSELMDPPSTSIGTPKIKLEK